jgi:segregation and condensation protein B
VELVEVASGFRYQVQDQRPPYVARLWTERQSKYSRALLETLALIAYRQPITRGEIEAVRGVAVSTQIIKTLEEREWIRVIGHRDVPGRPALYGTTRSLPRLLQPARAWMSCLRWPRSAISTRWNLSCHSPSGMSTSPPRTPPAC